MNQDNIQHLTDFWHNPLVVFVGLVSSGLVLMMGGLPYAIVLAACYALLFMFCGVKAMHLIILGCGKYSRELVE
ncbi:MAG TPA: hypothetical protein VJA28_00380 [Patescibacteria group bacterium]|nr:hypothetical protein [Patescibacteria group bacterium]